MSATLPQVLAVMTRGHAAWAAAVRETAGAPAQRAPRLAADLQALWPSPLYACLLRTNGGTTYSAQLQGGATPPGDDQLRSELQRWLDAGPPDAPAACLDVPADWKLPGHGVVAAPLASGGRRVGVLACGLPSSQPDAAALFLALAAERLSALLSHEECERATPDERGRQAWLANVSELTAIVAHEFNNLLNGILLHVAVLKQEIPKEMHSELDVIRGLGNNAAALVKQLQKYNSKYRGSLQPVDLNEAVRTATSERQSRGPAVAVRLELDPEVPPAQGKPRELARLINLLIDQAAAAMASNPGDVLVRTLRSGNRPQLRVEDTGPPIDETLLPKLFEPFTVVRPSGDEAALAVCHTLARHMHASLRAENRPGSGVALTVDFTPAAK